MNLTQPTHEELITEGYVILDRLTHPLLTALDTEVRGGIVPKLHTQTLLAAAEPEKVMPLIEELAREAHKPDANDHTMALYILQQKTRDPSLAPLLEKIHLGRYYVEIVEKGNAIFFALVNVLSPEARMYDLTAYRKEGKEFVIYGKDPIALVPQREGKTLAPLPGGFDAEKGRNGDTKV